MTTMKGSIAGLCSLAFAIAFAMPARAQMSEVKEKPPMYTYVGDWSIPRAQWGDMEKQMGTNQKDYDQAMSDGTLVAYGADTTLVHTADGFTHDNFWSSMSMAGVLKVLEQAYKSGSATTPVLASATKHSDVIVESHYYNWRPGSYKNAYTRLASWELKPDAPPDAVDLLSKTIFVPMLEKLLADGSLVEYEIDEEAIHTRSPNSFAVVIIAANGAGLDKFDAAVRDSLKSSPLSAPALGSMVDFKTHRDELARTNATYK
jgi:hypothetical protein